MAFPLCSASVLRVGSPLILLPVRPVASAASSLYDVVVSGGGMVGAATALAMAERPRVKEKKIHLIEGAKKK